MGNAKVRFRMVPELPFKTPKPLSPVIKKIGELLEQYSSFIDYHEGIKEKNEFRLTIDLKLKKEMYDKLNGTYWMCPKELS